MGYIWICYRFRDYYPSSIGFWFIAPLPDEWGIKVRNVGRLIIIAVEAPDDETAEKLFYQIAQDLRERQEINLSIVGDDLVISEDQGTILQ